MTAKLQIVLRGDPFPEKVSKSIFLAGPSPSEPDDPDWRPEAVQHLASQGYDGVVFIPYSRAPVPGAARTPYKLMQQWERDAIDRSDVVLFWVPRSAQLPGFTTNIEWGDYHSTGRAVLGHPAKTAGMTYFDNLATDENIPNLRTLSATVLAAITAIGPGAVRDGAEVQVPLKIWRASAFQDWYATQQKAGNALTSAKIAWTSEVGAPDKIPAEFILIAGLSSLDGRNSVEHVYLRQVEVTRVLMLAPNPRDPMQSEVLLERGTAHSAATAIDYEEVPQTPLSPAAKRALDRLADLSSGAQESVRTEYRRLAIPGTAERSASDIVVVSSAELHEIAQVRFKALRSLGGGVQVDIRTVEQILDPSSGVDWANIGMILSGLTSVCPPNVLA